MQEDPQNVPSRFVVGIDLGTTNSALAYVDSENPCLEPEVFAVPQLVAPSVVESREILPSFYYQPAVDEMPPEALSLPWSVGTQRHAVGILAQDQGAAAPGRLISSAKSWLSHGGVDRTAALLPWQGAPDVEKLSPVQVSAAYLAHLRAAWNKAWPEEPLEEQDLVITVPASFDEVARGLTVEAARLAGLPKIVLIEEPQAAFYAWLRQHEEGNGARGAAADDGEALSPGHRILICDVGGGTTDLSLIRVDSGENGMRRFHRMAVGDHLILGGDNLDLALARHLETKLASEGELSPRQWSVLVGRCRQAKEILLGEQPPERLTLNLPGSGSRLIGASLSVELLKTEAEEFLLEGFLPRVSLRDKPVEHGSGFREFGLPYAPDPGITRYLADFLVKNRAHGSGEGLAVRPDLVLVNGGFFAGEPLLNRLLEVLGSWFPDEQAWTPRLLRPERLDLAVALGAAHFGLVRRGQGERIHGGLPRAYYIGVSEEGGTHGFGQKGGTREVSQKGGTREEKDGSGETEVEKGNVGGASKALCLVPAGLEEGQEVMLQNLSFELKIRQPVEFPIFTSSSRTMDRPGELVPVDPVALSGLPPIRTVLRSGKRQEAGTVVVGLSAGLSEIGTLELWCHEQAGGRRWRLDFDVRAAVRTDLEAHAGEGEQEGFVEAQMLEAALAAIEGTFGPANKESPETLVGRLEALTEGRKWEWPPSLLRAMWEALMEHADGRRRSLQHEARWLNLLGYSLRPGQGYAADDWRVTQTWRLSHGGVLFQKSEGCRAEWWVLWRRIAAGLSAGQQGALSQTLIPRLRSFRVGRGGKKPGGKKKGQGGPKPGKHEAAEIWRLLGSLEWLEPKLKEDLGDWALREIESEGTRHLSGAPLWSLGRLGARVPAHGPLNTLVSPSVAEAWLERLLALSGFDRDLPFTVLQLARRTGDRFRDLPEALRKSAAEWLQRHRAPDRYAELVLEVGDLEEEDLGQVLGDSLPQGLRIL